MVACMHAIKKGVCLGIPRHMECCMEANKMLTNLPSLGLSSCFDMTIAALVSLSERV